MGEINQKIIILIEPNENGDLYASIAYDFGSGLQSNILSHEYALKADMLANIKLEVASDLDGVIFQRVPGTDDIKQYYLQSKAEYHSILNFVNVIKQVASEVGLKVYVSDGNSLLFINKFDLKRKKGTELDEFDLDEEFSNEALLRIMATTKRKNRVRRNEEHI
jgi:hypothetical protein